MQIKIFEFRHKETNEVYCTEATDIYDAKMKLNDEHGDTSRWEFIRWWWSE